MITLSDDKTTIRMTGACLLAEAETLQQYLVANNAAAVDWTACTYAHTAVIQVLFATKPRLVGPPADAFLQAYIMELIAPMDD